MRDILPTILKWSSDERPFVLARVVSTWGSAPRKVGSAMAITSGTEFVGSVSGGCVEAAVVEQATEVLTSGKSRLLEFGIANELAWSVGLTCGGQIKVLLELFPLFSNDPSERDVGATWLGMLRNGKSGTVTSWIGGSAPRHALDLEDPSGESGLVEKDGSEAFIHVIRGREVLIIIGATDIAKHLVRFAKDLEFETAVIDPRPVFSDPSRFDPKPDQILPDWPDEALENLSITPDTYAVMLSHNPRVDDPALHQLLKSRVRYIGALGSKKTQAKRRQRLLDSGFSEEEVNRIKGPVGLDIGASSPAEIALSIIAEIVATRNGASWPHS